MKSTDNVHVTYTDFLLHDNDSAATAIIPYVGHHIHTILLIISESEYDF